MSLVSTMISPDEIDALRAFIKKLRDGSLSDQERKDPAVIFHPLSVARSVIAFYASRKEKGLPVVFGGSHLNVEYFTDMAKNDRTLIFLLDEPSTYVEEMLNDYYKFLVCNPRHYVLSKSVDKLTGYDIHKIISYALEDKENK